MKNRMMKVVVLFVAALTVSGLPAVSVSAGPKVTPAKKWTVGMSQCNSAEPWRAQMNLDLKKAFAPHASRVTFILKDAQNDSLKQRAQIEEFVQAKVDLLIVSPNEAAPLTKPIAEAYQKGIPVIVLDRRVIGNSYTTFIGADNRLIGRKAGEWIRKKLGPDARIVELKGLMTSTPGQDRHTGFREGLGGDAKAAVVFEADMKWQEANARKEMESALAVHKQLDLVYSHNDPGAHGAYLAAKAAGRADRMLFVGIDGLPHEGQTYVRQGVLAASFEYPTGGKEAAETALKILQGRKVPKEITLKSRVFTRENIARGGEWLN